MSSSRPMGFAIVSAPTLAGDGKTVTKSEIGARLARVCMELERVVGVRAEPVEFHDYPSLLEAVAAGSIDFAWLAPVIALRASSAGRVLPIVLPVRRGVASFHSALFAPVGSPIQRPPDLAGARAAWVDRESASGHLLIRAALRAQGIDLARAFSEERFFGSHEAVVRAVIDGTADVGATYLHHDLEGSGILRAGWGDERVQIIARVGPIPSDVLAAAVHVPVDRIRAVRDALIHEGSPLAEAASVLLECDRLILCDSRHLDPLDELLGFLDDVSHPWKSIIPPRYARL